MKNILIKIANANQYADVQHLKELVDTLRPKNSQDVAYAASEIQKLTAFMKAYPHLREGLKKYIDYILEHSKHLSLYTDAGILSNRSFWEETMRKLSLKVLPPIEKPNQLASVLSVVFYKNTDYIWVSGVDNSLWIELLEEIGYFSPFQNSISLKNTAKQLLNALLILSQRIAYIGLESDIIDKLDKLEGEGYATIMRTNTNNEKSEENIITSENSEQYAFFLLNKDITKYVENYLESEYYHLINQDFYRKIEILLTKCNSEIEKIRNGKDMYGISVRLTHLTLRLEQHLQRVKTILAILQAQTRESEQNNTIAFCKEIVRSESQKYSIQQHFSDNLSLLSRKIIENTSKVGQHYITAGRTEYWNMCKSAVGGGAVVAFLCCLKVYVYYQHFPPFGEAFFYSMVYSLGFIFIYLFHFTLATKQPAMTASTIAASIAENSINGKNHDKSVNLLIEISRSQFISLIGNVIMAFPMAYLLGIGYYWITGEHFATPEKAAKMIAEIHPTQSGSLFFAFIAGIFLMTSGLIAGYYQNKAKYENFGERLKKHPFLIFFAQRSNKFTRIADYLADNLGGLASNFYLGIFLGSMSTIGFIVGLDLDIRHVTFSSASFGLALVGLENTMSLQQVIVTVGGIVGIGIVNVTTSFGLSILIALKSNNVSLKDTFGLFVELIARFFKNPLPFFLPPRK